MVLKAEEIFGKMEPHFKTHGASMVPKVQAVYAFEIRAKKADKPSTWTIDLKNGNGQIAKGAITGVKPDATFVMLDDDFMKLAMQKLNPQTAFMQVSESQY